MSITEESNNKKVIEKKRLIQRDREKKRGGLDDSVKNRVIVTGTGTRTCVFL